MAGEFEGIGDIVTGAAAAHAVSRAQGRRHDAAADIEHGLCLNCGTRLAGDYCHGCGQSAHIHRSLGAFFHDLLHGVLHFEGKTWRTLPLLAWRPGELTRRYIHGERARFVSPMALFLFAVFLLFGVASFAGGEPDLDNAGPDVATRLADEVQKLDDQIAALQADIASDKLDAEALAQARSDLAEAEQAQSAIMIGYRAMSAKNAQSAPNADPDQPATREDMVAEFMRGIDDGYREQAADAPLSQRPVVDASSDELKSLEKNWLGSKLAQGVRKARENPSLVFYKIKTNAYKFGWALIPLSVPFVWLVMVGRRMRERHVYDHMIFTTFSIAFMMLLLVVLMVAVMVGVPTGPVLIVGTLYPPFHMYRQLKGAYRLSRINALVRTAILLIFSLIALVLFVSLLVAAGLIA